MKRKVSIKYTTQKIGRVSCLVLLVLVIGIVGYYLLQVQQASNSEAQPDSKNIIKGNDNESNKVITNQTDYTRRNLPEGAKRRLGKGMLTDMQLSQDNKQLAIASTTGIWLYDVNTGKEKALLSNNADLVGLIAFSPDGKTLASTSGDYKCRIWDVENQKIISTFKLPKYWFLSISFLKDGKTLVGQGFLDNRRHTLTRKILTLFRQIPML